MLAQQQRASEQQTAIEGDRVAVKRRKNNVTERVCLNLRRKEVQSAVV